MPNPAQDPTPVLARPLRTLVHIITFRAANIRQNDWFFFGRRGKITLSAKSTSGREVAKMGKIAFVLGPLHFYWYGLIIAAAVLAAFLVALWQARRSGMPVAPLADLLLWGVPAGIVGARAVYVLANWELYRDNPLDILRLWQGGLAVFGALIAFILVLSLYSRQRRVPFWALADIAAPGLAAGQAVGQWANFVNQETFGRPSDAPWGAYIDFALRPAGYEQFDFFQPVPLYESAWNLFLLLVLLAAGWALRRRRLRWPRGSLALLYILLYSLGHYYFVGLRLDGETVWGVRLGQLFSALFAAACAWLARRRAAADDR
jgi:phosphatidylglycerol:prolipoprotein diacylglycerol transferase